MTDELNRTTEHDDLIGEALMSVRTFDAMKPEGAKLLRDELRKRGLCIAVDIPVAYKLTDAMGDVTVTNSKAFAVSACENNGYRMVPVYAEVE
jgi:hypothetical protein